MKKFKYTILLMMFGGLFASCEFLDKEPTRLTLDSYFNTAEEANSFLTGIYAELGQSSFYGNDYIYLAGGDDLSHYGGSGRAPATRGLICHNATVSDPAVTGFWYTLYSGINRANMFLENIDRVEDIDDATKAKYIAEARFLRAFYYFNLVQCWGDVPFRTSSTQDVTGLSSPRTDKQQIYDFIVTEMKDAAENGLPDFEADEPGRVSKSAAYGILARVCLFRAGEHYRDSNAPSDETTLRGYFQQAKDFALQVSGKHTLASDYWQVFIDMCSNQYNTDGTESIWEVEFAGNNTSDTDAEGRIGNVIGLAGPDLSNNSEATGESDPGYAYEFIFATPKLYRLYCIDPSGSVPEASVVPVNYTTDDLMGLGVDYTRVDASERDAAFEVAKFKVADRRFLWNIAPFAYTEKNGKNTGVTGRRFYEGAYGSTLKNETNVFTEGDNAANLRDKWLEYDNGRSNAYGTATAQDMADVAEMLAKNEGLEGYGVRTVKNDKGEDIQLIGDYLYREYVNDAGTTIKEWNEEPLVGDYTYRSGNNHFTQNIARACAKWRREYEADKKDKNFTSINFPILRYSDVLLMLAEAENELNGPANAVGYLNEVRQRAFGGDSKYNVDAAGLTKEELRQIIKDERGRELCFEMLRHFDLIRWGELADRMSELVSWAQIGGEWNQGPTNVYTYFMLDDTYNYFPIPDAEISVNREITSNNPGW